MAMIEPFLASFGFTNFAVDLALSDVSNEQALVRQRGGEGASLAWTMGHLCAYREGALALVQPDRKLEWGDYNGSAGDIAAYPALSALKGAWDGLAKELDEALGNLTDEQIVASVQGGPHHEQRVFDKLVFYTYHEACHVGVISVIRKELGLPAISELVMRSM
jgi:hypothetical protein